MRTLTEWIWNTLALVGLAVITAISMYAASLGLAHDDEYPLPSGQWMQIHASPLLPPYADEDPAQEDAGAEWSSTPLPDGSFLMSQGAFEQRYFRGRTSTDSGGAYEVYCSQYFQSHPPTR